MPRRLWKHTGRGRRWIRRYQRPVSYTHLAKAAGADVEAEIGIVTGHEGREFGLKEVSEAYTDPDLAARYVKDTGIDALAASVGTVHGFYTCLLYTSRCV